MASVTEWSTRLNVERSATRGHKGKRVPTLAILRRLSRFSLAHQRPAWAFDLDGLRDYGIVKITQPRDGLRADCVKAAVDDEGVIDVDGDHVADDHYIAFTRARISGQLQKLMQPAFQVSG